MNLKLKSFDWALLFLVGALLIFLFKYTDIPKKGIIKTVVEGYQNLNRMDDLKNTPSSSIDNPTQEKIKDKFDQDSVSLFCQNSFFPLLPGAKWTYRKSEKVKEDILEIGIPSPENNNYFIDGRSLSLKNWTIRTLMRCQNGNNIQINDLNFFNLGQWKNFVTKPCEENKFYFSLPAESELESKKNNIRREEGCLERVFINPENTEEKINRKEKLETAWEVVGWEKIKVPAGDYEAVKVNLKIVTTEEGKNSLEESITFWVAKEVGIIKIENKSNANDGIIDDSFASISELTAFQIPTEQKYKKRTFSGQ